MKSEFKASPVYLSNDDRIEAHFITCFISLIIYRLLEKRLDEKFTCHEIISGLKDMEFFEIKGEGYVPTYTRTDFTDALHEAFGFRTDYQIVTSSMMKKIFKRYEKIKNITHFLPKHEILQRLLLQGVTGFLFRSSVKYGILIKNHLFVKIFHTISTCIFLQFYFKNIKIIIFTFIFIFVL